MQAVDSASPIAAGAAKAAGYVAVARYLSQTPAKNITRPELGAALHAGLSVILVYEDGASDVNGGVASGQAHGKVARQLLDGLGLPEDTPVVYVAVDEDLSPQLYPVALQHLQTFGQVARCRVGVYGPGPLIAYCQQRDILFGWETGASSWNEGVHVGQIAQRVEQVDVGGITCDVDDLLALDYGQWPRPSSPVPPATADIFQTEALAMLATNDQIAFNCQVRQWWYELRTDTLPAHLQDELWYLFHVAGNGSPGQGFGGNIDFVLAWIHDTAGAALRT